MTDDESKRNKEEDQEESTKKQVLDFKAAFSSNRE